MAVYVTTKQDVDKYYASEALGQSTLKKLLKGFDYFMAKHDSTEESDSLTIGSAVDILLTGNQEDFINGFYVSSMESKPSDTEMSIVKRVFDDLSMYYGDDKEWLKKPFNHYLGSIKISVDAHNWQPKWKDETRVDKMVKAGSVYFEVLKESIGKTVLDTETYNLINKIVNSLQTNERTSLIFNREFYENNPEYDIYYQLPIYFTHFGIECKGLLDVLIIKRDKQGRAIKIIPIDLKTMFGNTLDFLSRFKSLRYDIQGAYYTRTIMAEQSTFRDILAKYNGPNDKFPYVERFQFVVESNTFPGKPLLYQMTEETMKIGQYGRDAVNVNDLVQLFGDDEEKYSPIPIVREIKGFHHLLEDYIYYSNQGWRQDRLLDNVEGNAINIHWDRLS